MWKSDVKKNLSGNVLFAGYYGKDNVGDDCFGVVSTWGARQYWNSRSVRLLSDRNLEGPTKTESCLAQRKLFRGQWLPESIWQIARSTCVVWSGGSIFHSRQPVYTPKYLSMIASRLGVTAAGAIGVSLGPYRTNEHQRGVHDSLRDLRFLSLRDQASYEEALSIELPYQPVLAADLALLLPKMCPDYASAQRGDKILGVTVCHYERYANCDQENESRREGVLLESLVGLSKAGFDGVFRLFVFNGNKLYGDEALTVKFAEHLKNAGARVEVIKYGPDPMKIWKDITQCSAMVSTRLHGAIFAAAANVPCVLIEYHRKCTDFLRDIGVDGDWQVGDAECSGQSLATKLMALLERRTEEFYPNREILVCLAENNFRFV
jgi:polysaccharide pyruvyl transferase WcaK-like protein